jgi:hypothetical protein
MRNSCFLSPVFAVIIATLGLGISVVACGDDDNDESDSGSGSEDSTNGSGGSKKGSGGFGEGGTGTIVAADCETETICGGEPCSTKGLSDKMWSLLCVNACCTETGRCGSRYVGAGQATGAIPASQCSEQNQPGTPDSTCPSFATIGGDDAGENSWAQWDGVSFQPCCRPDGRCGITFDLLGLGCVAIDDIKNAMSVPRDLIESKTCTR